MISGFVCRSLRLNRINPGYRQDSSGDFLQSSLTECCLFAIYLRPGFCFQQKTSLFLHFCWRKVLLFHSILSTMPISMETTETLKTMQFSVGPLVGAVICFCKNRDTCMLSHPGAAGRNTSCCVSVVWHSYTLWLESDIFM